MFISIITINCSSDEQDEDEDDDGDGVLYTDDKFTLDPAASKDIDIDAYPDE